jgi:photosystem II stability/assembly factor-like uncharacterized protein
LTNLFLGAEEKKKPAPESLFSKLSLGELKFRAIGPALTSGRISDFAVNPTDGSEYFVASSSGGVWKTVNAGTTFEPVFDGQGSYSIGCVVMDPGNHNVVWVGTGENNNQRSVAYGDGVYKSEDGGKTWKNMGLRTSEHIGMIAIDRRNSDIVYVAAYGPLWRAGGERGLYKTTDGGKTWQAVLTISEHTGVSEVHLDPRNPDLVYAVAHQRRRHVFTQIGGGPESAIHKSKDGGATWEKITRGLPEGDLGRIGLAISPADPERIYAIVEAKAGQGGFYCSTNRGVSWERRSGYHSSGNYYQEIICDPKDPERVYSMDVYLQVTDDGGLTWKNLGERSKHIDNHAIWINPADTDHYLVGSDGGIYESFDRGRTWKFMTNLPVTQFYKIAVDYAEPFYHVYGGTQDNYSLGGPSRTASAHGIVSSDWITTQGGDGFESQVDPKDPNIVYAQSQHGNLVRFDKKSGEALGIQPKERKGEEAYRWNWDSPLLISPHSNTRLYFAANKVFRSDDRGNSWTVIGDDLTRRLERNTLEVMGRIWSPDAVARHASTSRYGNIVALDESPLKEDMLYVGTDDGLIQVTEDAGKSWRRIDAFPGVPERTYVNDIVVSRHEQGTVYAAFNNHKNGDFKPYVLKSNDAGRTWQSIASNLPERGSVYALAEDHVRKDLLFAGTEFGLFVTIDGGLSWSQMKGGLPTIAIRDIAVQKREDDLVLASFGRGIFILDDYSPLRQIDETLLNKEACLFPVKEAWMFMESYPLGNLGTKEKGFQGETYFSAPNPPVGAVFSYYLKESIQTLKEKREKAEKDAIKNNKRVPYPTYEQIQAEQEEEKPHLIFSISDEENNVVRTLRAPAAAGLHRIVWDFRYPSLNATRAEEDSPAESSPSGTPVMPGKYRVYLSKSAGGTVTRLTETASFAARPLGNVTLPAADRSELASFQRRVAGLSRDANAAAAVVRDLGERTRHFRAALKRLTSGDAGLAAEIRMLETKLAESRIKLYGDRRLVELDRDAEPGLLERINEVAYSHWRSTAAPTKSQRSGYDIVAEALQPLLQELRKIVEIDVKKIEKTLEDLGAAATPGRLPERKKS